MITAQRQRGRRRAAAVAASIAIAAGLVGGLATAASAEGDAELIGRTAGQSADVEGTLGGVNKSAEAGLFDVKVGDQVVTAYCLDLQSALDEGTEFSEITPDQADIDNLDKIEAILRWYHPNGDGPADHPITGTPAQKAAATQAAVWHFANGFDLDESDNDSVVVANYLAILAAVAGGLEGFPEPELTITPPASTEGSTGGLVGPYVVHTNVGGLTITPSAGVTLHNADGTPFAGEIVDGTELWLSSDAEGAGTVSVSGTAQTGDLRIFFKEGMQELGLVTLTGTEVSAEAPVSFTTPPPTTVPPTTSTTVVDTTTTTVPITPDTTVVTVPSTTVPITPQSSGGLPNTGARTMLLVAVAAVLLAVGTGFGIVSRRKRLDG